MRITEQFIDEFGRILQNSRVTVVPDQLANIKGFFEGIGRVSTAMGESKEQTYLSPPTQPQRKIDR
jgi:C-terminal region of band_7